MLDFRFKFGIEPQFLAGVFKAAFRLGFVAYFAVVPLAGELSVEVEIIVYIAAAPTETAVG